MKYCVAGYVINHSEDFEKLLDFDSDKITDLLNDYVDQQMDKGDKHDTISSALVAPEALFEINRKVWFKKEIKRNNTKTKQNNLQDKESTWKIKETRIIGKL